MGGLLPAGSGPKAFGSVGRSVVPFGHTAECVQMAGCVPKCCSAGAGRGPVRGARDRVEAARGTLVRMSLSGLGAPAPHLRRRDPRVGRRLAERSKPRADYGKSALSYDSHQRNGGRFPSSGRLTLVHAAPAARSFALLPKLATNPLMRQAGRARLAASECSRCGEAHDRLAHHV